MSCGSCSSVGLGASGYGSGLLVVRRRESLTVSLFGLFGVVGGGYSVAAVVCLSGFAVCTLSARPNEPG